MRSTSHYQLVVFFFNGYQNRQPSELCIASDEQETVYECEGIVTAEWLTLSRPQFPVSLAFSGPWKRA